jgi:exonuclease SbcC
VRPVELEIAGFTAYRDETTIDFRNADLFALTGPTGSGKSSIVDAIVFALYGSVPRYGDRRAVEPVITLGKNEARIQFDFTVGDDAYRVARVVRRTKGGGATTAEARLEHGRVTLASGADEVTKKVEELLGLAYEHFIKAVVLPQGEFARFLHDKPRERQELLRELLDLRVYRRIRDLANERKSVADRLLAGHQREVDLLAERAGGDEDAASRRVSELERLRDTIARIRTQVASIDEQLKDATKQIADEEAAMSALAIRSPDGLDELVGRISDADTAVDKAKSAMVKASEALSAHEQSIAGLPNPAILESQIAQQRSLEDLLGRHERATEQLAKSAADIEQKRRTAGAVAQAHSQTEEELERLRRAHAAHELAANVVVGEPCPVCGVPIAEIPKVEPIADVERAVADVARRTADLDAARRALTEAELAGERSRATADEISAQIGALRAGLDGVPGIDELARTLAATAAAQQRLAELKATALTSANELRAAEQRREALTEARAEALAKFHGARDRVAHLEPPPVVPDDLAIAWAALTEWAVARSQETHKRLEGLRADAKQLVDDRSRLTEDLDTHLAGMGADLTPDEAVFSARKDLEGIREAKQRTKELAADITAEKDRSHVAAALSRHLHSNRFESWILEEALIGLTVGANQLLDELSSGIYSLEIDKAGFTVIDHRNADQRRSVRTLSGGETFLVSLALALSLSEELTRMSSQGKLESILLDEGFGTLDQETLDVVASVVQQLGAKGLTVGLISHVPDLAEQVPTRFVVTKDVSGAHVERIDA